LIRERDEEIFSLTSERMNLSVDLKNARLTGDQLKQENHQLNQKRIDLETLCSDFKTEIHNLQTQLRQSDQ
jgi:chromosome segregation ATPase